MRPSSWPQISDPPSGPLLHNLSDLRLKTHVQHSIGLGLELVHPFVTLGMSALVWGGDHWKSHLGMLATFKRLWRWVPQNWRMSIQCIQWLAEACGTQNFKSKYGKYIYIYIIFWLRSGSTYGLKTTTLKQSHVEIGNLQFRHCGVLFKTCFFPLPSR